MISYFFINYNLQQLYVVLQWYLSAVFHLPIGVVPWLFKLQTYFGTSYISGRTFSDTPRYLFFLPLVASIITASQRLKGGRQLFYSAVKSEIFGIR